MSELTGQYPREYLRPHANKAAMYVRMSTDHQKYSTENQIDAIRKYASLKNWEIVTTYADKGKSGLKIEGRDEFQRMLRDVKAGTARFSKILVLDITRWGRFQNADESGRYEYDCFSHGVDVHYVAEQFDNDGSPITSVFKSIKRTMAGEYSRELSVIWQNIMVKCSQNFRILLKLNNLKHFGSCKFQPDQADAGALFIKLIDCCLNSKPKVYRPTKFR